MLHGMTQATTDDLLTISQTAQFLTVGEGAIRKHCDSGRLPSVQIGGQRLLRRIDVVRAALAKAANLDITDAGSPELIQKFADAIANVGLAQRDQLLAVVPALLFGASEQERETIAIAVHKAIVRAGGSPVAKR